AQCIQVQPGQEQHVEIRLPALPAYEIRGRVIAEGPFVNVVMRRAASDLLFPSPIQPNWDAKTRTFKATGVTRGDYIIEVSNQVDGKQFFASAPVTVGDSDMDGVLLRPSRLSELKGTLHFEGDAAAMPKKLPVQLLGT